MNIMIEKHEPATRDEEYFAWINLKKNGDWGFMCESPNNIDEVNRYIVQKNDISEYIKYLQKENIVYLIFNFSDKSNPLTQIQKLLIKKKLLKKGFKKTSLIHGLYSKEVYDNSSVDIELIEDFYLDKIFIVAKKRFNEDELIKILQGIDFFKQPSNLASYYPTSKVISALNNNEIGIIYFKLLNEGGNYIEDKDVFICYCPIDYSIL